VPNDEIVVALSYPAGASVNSIRSFEDYNSNSVFNRAWSSVGSVSALMSASPTATVRYSTCFFSLLFLSHSDVLQNYHMASNGYLYIRLGAQAGIFRGQLQVQTSDLKLDPFIFASHIDIDVACATNGRAGNVDLCQPARTVPPSDRLVFPSWSSPNI
jgi:hypothetical protein